MAEGNQPGEMKHDRSPLLDSRCRWCRTAMPRQQAFFEQGALQCPRRQGPMPADRCGAARTYTELSMSCCRAPRLQLALALC